MKMVQREQLTRTVRLDPSQCVLFTRVGDPQFRFDTQQVGWNVRSRVQVCVRVAFGYALGLSYSIVGSTGDRAPGLAAIQYHTSSVS